MICILKGGETKLFRIEMNLPDRLQDFASQRIVIFKIVIVILV